MAGLLNEVYEVRFLDCTYGFRPKWSARDVVRYITKTFKEQFEKSINTCLLNIRIPCAKHLLRFSDKSVEAIGLERGLGAAHYFSAKFKDVEGIPPSVYQEQ